MPMQRIQIKFIEIMWSSFHLDRRLFKRELIVHVLVDEELNCEIENVVIT